MFAIMMSMAQFQNPRRFSYSFEWSAIGRFDKDNHPALGMRSDAIRIS
jgi:hypothetical protein